MILLSCDNDFLADFISVMCGSFPTQTRGRYREDKEYIKSWSHQLFINYILTLYENLVKLGVASIFVLVLVSVDNTLN